jgi:hypothetical protein
MSDFSDKVRAVEVVHPQDIDTICQVADELDRLEAMLLEQDKQMTIQFTEGRELRESRDGWQLDASRYKDDLEDAMNTIKQAFMDGYFAGHGEAGRDAEEHGKASTADDEDAIAAYEGWLKSIPAQVELND